MLDEPSIESRLQLSTREASFWISSAVLVDLVLLRVIGQCSSLPQQAACLPPPLPPETRLPSIRPAGDGTDWRR